MTRMQYCLCTLMLPQDLCCSSAKGKQITFQRMHVGTEEPCAGDGASQLRGS